MKKYNAVEQNVYKTNWGSTVAYLPSAHMVNGRCLQESVMASRFRGHYDRAEKQRADNKKLGARRALEAKYGTRHARAPRTKTEEANLSPNERARMKANNDLRTYIEKEGDHDPFKQHARRYEAPIGKAVAGYRSEVFDNSKKVEDDIQNADPEIDFKMNLGYFDVEHDEFSKNSDGSQVRTQQAVSDLHSGDARKNGSQRTRATRPQSTDYNATRSGTLEMNMSKYTKHEKELASQANITGDMSDIKSSKYRVLATNPS